MRFAAQPPTWLRLSAAAAVSGAAFALYARVAWPWLVLGWVGLVPWLAVLDDTPTFRGALAAGALMCEAFVLAVFAWLPSAIQNYTGAPWVVSLGVVVLVAPLLQPQFIALALARQFTQRHARSFWRTTLVSACAYVGVEWACPKLFADTLGHGLYASVWLRQAADLAGAHGLTFVLIVANECGLATLRVVREWAHRSAPSSALAPVTCVVAMVFALLGYGALRYRQFGDAGSHGDPITAGIVQADITHYGELAKQMGTYDAARMILDTHFALSSEALQRAPVDVLVWPETVYPTTFGSPKSDDGAAFDREIGAFAAQAGVPLVFGAYDVENGDEFNAAFFLQPATDGRVTFETYRKAAPFPLTERVPGWLDSDAVRHWLPWLGTWKAGRGGQVVALSLRDGRTLRVAPQICYDALFPQYAIAAVRQGAEVVITLSNDSWFTFGNLPRLILMISAFRSIETRRPQVRATNTGISAIITPTGEFLKTIGVDERGSMVAALTPERGATTLMLAWGDWFGPAASVVGVALLVFALPRRRAHTTVAVSRPIPPPPSAGTS
jgi:apolipoprotein N-acyltransferase